MAINRGKDFENAIKESFEKVPNTNVVRLLDPQRGYAGVRNICDFVVYHYPHQYLIECKSVYGNTLPFSNITKNQWEGLTNANCFGVRSGYMVWFIDHDITLFVTAKLLDSLKQDGYKSLNVKDVDKLSRDTNLYVIKGTKKRIMFEYDMKDFFENF